MTTPAGKSTLRAVAYIREKGSATVIELIRAVKYDRSAKDLIAGLTFYAEHNGEIYRQQSSDGSRDPNYQRWNRIGLLAERPYRCLPNGPLDMKCLGRPIIPVR